MNSFELLITNPDLMMEQKLKSSVYTKVGGIKQGNCKPVDLYCKSMNSFRIVDHLMMEQKLNSSVKTKVAKIILGYCKTVD
jgi:hypothetical protein